MICLFIILRILCMPLAAGDVTLFPVYWLCCLDFFVENWVFLIIHGNSRNPILSPKACYCCCLFSNFPGLICKVYVFAMCSH